MKFYYVYMIRCSDSSYYVGITNDVERRMNEHSLGLNPTSFTHKRRPVHLVYSAEFQNVDEAIAWEKRIKRWNRQKKKALIQNDWDALPELAKRRTEHRGHASRRSLRSLLSMTRKALFQALSAHSSTDLP